MNKTRPFLSLEAATPPSLPRAGNYRFPERQFGRREDGCSSSIQDMQMKTPNSTTISCLYAPRVDEASQQIVGGPGPTHRLTHPPALIVCFLPLTLLPAPTTNGDLLSLKRRQQQKAGACTPPTCSRRMKPNRDMLYAHTGGGSPETGRIYRTLSL